MKRTVAMCTYVSNYLSFFCELVSAVEANNGNANCCNVFVLIFFAGVHIRQACERICILPPFVGLQCFFAWLKIKPKNFLQSITALAMGQPFLANTCP